MSDSRRDSVSNSAPNSVPAEEISPHGQGVAKGGDLRSGATIGGPVCHTVAGRVTQAGSTFIDLRGEELLELRLNGAPLPTNAYEAKFGVPVSVLFVQVRTASQRRQPEH